MAADGVANGVLLPGFILPSIAGGCLFCGLSATTAMWPAVGHGVRPRNEATGSLPAGGLSRYAEAERRQNNQLKRPATGRWRTYMRQRVDAAQPQLQQLPERRPGEAARDVTACAAPGAAFAEPAAVRPFSLLQGI